MAAAVFADTAKVMPKGQVTIPKDVRAVLGVSAGDKVTFLVEGATVRVVNACFCQARNFTSGTQIFQAGHCNFSWMARHAA